MPRNYDIALSHRLDVDLRIDSFALLELLFELEDALELVLEPDDLLAENFQTVGDLVKLVENRGLSRTITAKRSKCQVV